MGVEGVSVSRAWADTATKWRLHTRSGDDGRDRVTAAGRAFDQARAALLEGRLDDARTGFLTAAGLRDCALDHVGLADVAAAEGNWSQAARMLRRARAIDSGHPMVRIGLAQARIADGDAGSAVDALSRMVADGAGRACGSTDEVSRYYLAAALLAVADQARGQTRDGVPVITGARQLEICDEVADRVLALGVESQEVTAAANRLRQEVAAGRRWTWDRAPAVVYAVLTVVLGLGAVIGGGLLGSVALVVAGVALGPAVIYWIVVGYRREQWRRVAERVAPQVWRHGVAD